MYIVVFVMFSTFKSIKMWMVKEKITIYYCYSTENNFIIILLIFKVLGKKNVKGSKYIEENYLTLVGKGYIRTLYSVISQSTLGSN